MMLCQSGWAIGYSTLAAFSDAAGLAPRAGLLLASNGLFYGTSTQGGAGTNGTVFVMGHSGTPTNLVSFNGTNGAQPYASLALGGDGNFYGTTYVGGESDQGVIFRLTPDGALTCLASFDGSNGAHPMAPLAAAPNGAFYGTASEGGSSGNGVLFQFSTNGGIRLLASFQGTNGIRPTGALVLSTNSNNVLYGTTSGGGSLGYGTVFSFNLTNQMISTLHSFAGTSEGSGPQAGLAAGSAAFYGTTAAGGTNGNLGTLFRITASGTFSNLFTFGRTNGARPMGQLIQGPDSAWYGTTLNGGTDGQGTVFRLSSSNTLTVLHSFSRSGDGGNPYSGLALGTNGCLYGVTSAGGAHKGGTAFQINAFPPVITAQSSSQSVATGDSFALGVQVAGSQPMSFQWQLNSNNLADNSKYSGARTTVLSILSATKANAGSYRVIVHNSGGTITNTPIAVSVVDPLGTNHPTLTIASPSSGASLATTFYAIRGTAAGPNPVAQVFFRLNGSHWQLATLEAGGSKWSATATLTQGSNWVQAYAVDLLGAASPTNAPLGFFCGLNGTPVRVQVNGQGTTSPNYDGVYLSASSLYRIKAAAASGFVFSNWVGSILAEPVWAVSSNTTLSFQMQTNLVIEANFVTNPFIALKGTYSGLFFESNGVRQASSGLLTFNLASQGAFSGSVWGDGGRYSLSGRFDLSGAAQCVVKRSRTNELLITLHLNGSRVLGQVVNAAWASAFAGDLAAYDGKTKVPPQAGCHTLALPGAIGSSQEPAGDGWAAISVDKTGRLSLSGSLADGAKISQSASLSTNGQWPLYVSLYQAKGSLLGWATLNDRSNSPSGNVSWIKPPIAAAAFYPNGFAVETNLVGSKYAAPGGKTNVLSFSMGSVVFSDGNLLNGLTNGIALLKGNAIGYVSGSKLSLKLKPANGTFSGSVLNPATGKQLPFNGVLLPSSDTGLGYFLGTNLSGRVRISNDLPK
jgi:uncharacterized repeat protein (TIGR03803 family)